MSFRSINPANGVLGNSYPVASVDEIESVLTAAEAAFDRNRRSSIPRRTAFLHRSADLLENHAETFGALITTEMGKPIMEAIGEVRKCAWVCRYYAEEGPAFLQARSIQTDASDSRVLYQPLGVILGIMPWNFPFWQVLRFAAPTILAGNAVVVKHAPSVPECARALDNLFADAAEGDPVYFNLFAGIESVESIVADARIQGVSLTGSVRAGKAVAKIAATHLKQSVLELGGSDPFVVLGDADLDDAVNTGIQSRFLNNGQSCIAAKRFIVEESVADNFLKLFVSRVEKLVVGDPSSTDTEIGPMARQDLLETLHEQVTRSIALGASARTGARRIDGPGFFYQPTVLVDVAPGQPAFDDEVFGPVAAVIQVKDAQEALEMANRTSFGLGAAVFTEDPDKATVFSEELNAGNVFINGLVKSDPRIPFGGIRDSGWGRELSLEGVRSFVNVKTVWKK